MIVCERSRRKQSAEFLEWASLFPGKYLAMIVVYADESGTHGLKSGGKEPAPGVYGFLASKESWDIFRIKWKAKLDQHKAPYFHFRELTQAARMDPKIPSFYGWSDERADDFIHDMAIVASCGPIPFGGFSSIKGLFPGRTDKEAHLGSYEKSFERFFRDFTSVMDIRFPNEKEKVSFFFAQNNNDDWIQILNKTIKKAKNRDRRIGVYGFMDFRTDGERAFPCQAADLLAYVYRQKMETTFEKGYHQKTRLLDFIVLRHGFPKEDPRSLYADYSEMKWESLIIQLRGEKKLKESQEILQGLTKQQFYPFQHSERLRLHMASWVAAYPRLFPKQPSPREARKI